MHNGRLKQGFPEMETVDMWLNTNIKASCPGPERVVMGEVKNKEIPVLESYSEGANDSFWRKFPKRSLPTSANTKVNILKLRKMVLKASNRMSRTELRRAKKVISDLRQGANAYQRQELPPISTSNAKSAVEHGALLTDTIATWVKKGFVAGPFDTPPVPGFRENP